MIRKEVAVIDQVIELRKRGQGPRSIARCLGIARNTVKKILKQSEEGTLKEKVSFSEKEAWARALNWEEIHQEYSKGVSLKIIHPEHAPTGVSYHQFWYVYRKKFPYTPTVTMRLVHKAAERTFFDFTDGINLVDRRTGEITSTQLLCSVLPFSSYTWGEFVLNQKQPIFMGSIERAWKYFGGVTPYVTVDNLKSGVSKAHIYDPVVNPGFVDFANHWGFAVIPARPYKPRDKAANESGIGVIQRSFYQEVRNQIFYSLNDLNQKFREFLERFNHQLMKEYGVSRWDRFQVEKAQLKPLAEKDYELCEWKTSKVHADCHIQLENKFYSVPFQYVGRTVRVRLTTRLIEIFSEEQLSLAVHARLTGKERVSTQEGHYPEKKVGLTRFEVKHAKTEADRIGPETRALMEELFNTDCPLRYLRRAQGILRLVQSSQVSKEALEYACKQGRIFNKTNYDYIKSTAKFYHINGNRPVIVAPKRELSQVHLHRNST
jgi:transposase